VIISRVECKGSSEEEEEEEKENKSHKNQTIALCNK
jgi:hypothetical protein